MKILGVELQKPSFNQITAAAVMAAGLWMADESPASRAGRIAAQTLIFGAPTASEVLVQRMEAVTAEDMRRLGARLLAPGLSATAVLGPKAASKAGKVFAETLNA